MVAPESLSHRAASGSSPIQKMKNNLICFGTGLRIQGVLECSAVTAAGHRVESAADPLTQQLCEVLFKLDFDFWGQGSDYRQNDVQSKLCHLKHICFLTEHIRHVLFLWFLNKIQSQKENPCVIINIIWSVSHPP